MAADAPRQATVLSSLNAALLDILERDRDAVVLGEDILDPYGGAFKVTRGLSTRFPDRVFTTPVSEAAIVGLSVGLALRGRHPIAELMFGDFSTLAADQLINSAAKFRWMFNDGVTVPLVVRAPMGGRRGYGPTHSQSLEKHFLGVAGLWVVAPHVLGDPGALLRQAVEWPEPVLFVESKTCYARPLLRELPGTAMSVIADGTHPFPTTLASVPGGAPDAMLFCYGGGTPLCIDAHRALTEEEGLRVDLTVLSQLSPAPVSHVERLIAERRPPICVYVEEGTREAGWGAELLARVEEASARLGLDITHRRVGAADEPLGSGRELELRTLPSSRGIVDEVLGCL